MVGSTGDDKKTWVGHINHFIQIVLSAILTAKTFFFFTHSHPDQEETFPSFQQLFFWFVWREGWAQRPV